MKKEEKGIIAEGIYVPFFEKGHLGGRNSNPNDALNQLDQNPALVGLKIATVTYDLRTGMFSRSSWQEYKKDVLPEMTRYDYYPLRQGQSMCDALDGRPSHYFWDVFWSVTTAEDPEVIGIVVQKIEIAPTGEELRYDEPFILKAFGQTCAEGEIPMPAGLQSSRIK